MKVETQPLLQRPKRASQLLGRQSTESSIHGNNMHGYGAYNTLAARSSSKLHSFIGPKTKRTFDGVFLPVSLSVFGVVLFIRLPWIVGQCGLWLTLLSIILCYSVSGLTTISLAAISTNGYTGDGGPYMMVSRTLGPQIGINVGVIFVLSNIVTSAMYLTGGTDVIVKALEAQPLIDAYQSHHYFIMVGVSSLMLLFLLAISFLRIEKQFRLVCFVLTIVAILDVWVYIAAEHHRHDDGGYVGFSWDRLKTNWEPHFTGDNNFPTTLSILFPGVTGLMSGVCLSGELRNGAKAIPRGIGYAWIMSLVTYLIMAFLIAGAFDREKLDAGYRALQFASHIYVFLPGEMCSAFAAVLAGLVGSSRVIKAMSKDDLIPVKAFKAVSNMSNERSIFIVWIAIQLILLLGDQYEYASMFASHGFLANFLALNVATLLTSATSLPSFRPVYNFFSSVTALCGSISCIVVMFTMSPLTAAIVISLMLAMLFASDAYIEGDKVSWGDASQPLLFYVVRKWLLRLDERKEHIKHWRPSVIQIVGDPLCSLNLMHLANNLKKGGLYELAVIVKGSFSDTADACFQWKGWLMDFIGASGIKAFAVVTFGDSLRTGVQYLLRNAGLGGMRPNTVLLSLDELLMKEAFDDFYANYRGEGFSFQGGGGGGVNLSGGLFPANSGGGGGPTMTTNAFRTHRPAGYDTVSNGGESGGDSTPTTPIATPLNMPSTRTGHVTPPLRRKKARFVSNADETAEAAAAAATAVAISTATQQVPSGSSSQTDPEEYLEDGEHSMSPPKGLRKDETMVFNNNNEHANGEDSSKDHNEPCVTFGDVGPLMQSEVYHSGNYSDYGHHAVRDSEELSSPFSSGADNTTPLGGQQPIMIHSYRSYRKQKKWHNFFMSNKSANETKELKQIEKMTEQRSHAKHFCKPDITSYTDHKEFVDIVRDINALNLTVLIARGIDKLDKQIIKQTTKEKSLFIDVWNPDEYDPIMFLMAHTLHMTSVWKKYTHLRIVSMVTYVEDEEPKREEMKKICKEHRITVEQNVVVSIERQLPLIFDRLLTVLDNYGLGAPVDDRDSTEEKMEWIEELLDQKHGKALVMNMMMRFANLGDGCIGTDQTALCMIRVTPPSRMKKRRHMTVHPRGSGGVDGMNPMDSPSSPFSNNMKQSQSFMSTGEPTEEDLGGKTEDDNQAAGTSGGHDKSPVPNAINKERTRASLQPHQSIDEYLQYRRSIRHSVQRQPDTSPSFATGAAAAEAAKDSLHGAGAGPASPLNNNGSFPYEQQVEDARFDEEGEQWLEDLCRLSEGLPPVLMVQGGSVRCRSNEW